MADSLARYGLEEFAEFLRPNEPLAPYTSLRMGGPAEFLALPRTLPELSALVRHCTRRRIPLHILGGGGNLLIREEGVPGVVLRLSEPAFTQIEVKGRQVHSGAGATLSAFISEAARHGLAGVEGLVGITATVGGAVRCNAGDRSNEIGPLVRKVHVLDSQGEPQTRERDELRFAHRWSNLDDPVLVAVDCELETDSVEAIVKRLRKAWIQRKARQPLSFQAAARLFKDPQGMSAAALISQSEQGNARVGGAEVSDRDANYVIVHPGAAARDVLGLIELLRSKVRERSGIELALELSVW